MDSVIEDAIFSLLNYRCGGSGTGSNLWLAIILTYMNWFLWSLAKILMRRLSNRQMLFFSTWPN